VLKEYKQGRLVYEKSTSIPDYLCFTALEAGQFTLTIPAAVTPTYLSYVEWSKDGRTWNHTDNTSEAVTIDVQVASGEKVYWRGSGNCMTATTTTAGRQSIFSSTAGFDASGHLISLLTGDNLLEHLTNYNTDGVRNVTFARLFEDCTTLVDASSLVLPTFTSWHTYIFFSLFAGCTSLVATPSLPCMDMATGCYQSTFQNCSSLTTAPSLPATSRAANCYYVMFQGCSNLTEMPALPATVPFSGCYRQMFQYCTSLTATHDISLTSMASDCCRSMFFGCTSLTSAPDLKVAVLATNCYQTMFQNCTNLKYVKCLATDISATNCLQNWLYGVSSTGTFIQAEGVTWTRGASGIPTGWVDVEKRTMPSGYKQVEYLQAVKPYPSNYNAAIVGTGIVLDPSQDTIEFAVWPRLDEDGYLINGGGSTVGEMPFANTSSPTTTTAKVGLFYILYRVNSSTNLLSAFFTRVNGDGTNKALGFSLDATNKVTDNPQTIRVECSATSSVMYLNGTQVASRSGYTVDTSDMTTLQAFVLAYNNKIYSWEHPFY
jgi:hypothetical protein